MDRLARRILEAPVAIRRATGGALLCALVTTGLTVGAPASAQSAPPQPLAGNGECVGPDGRLVDDQGRAVFHGTTWGLPLSGGPDGSIYVADTSMVRRVPPAGAPPVYLGSDLTDFIKGVAALGSRPVWTDTKTGAVRIRTATGPEAAVTLVEGPSAGDSDARLKEHGIAVDDDGVIYFAVPAANQVYKFAGSTVTPVSSTPLPTPHSVAALEEDGVTVLYVGSRGANVLRVDTATGAATPVGPALTVGSEFAHVAVDSVTRQLFIADRTGILQVDLPTDRTKATRILAHDGWISGLAVLRSSPQAEPRLVFAVQNMKTGRVIPNPNHRPGEGTPTPPEIEEIVCDLRTIVPNAPVPPSSSSSVTSPPTSTNVTVPDTTPTSIPRLEARDAEPQPLPQNNNQQQTVPQNSNQQQTVTNPEQLAGNRAEGDFGQFDPFVANTGALNGQFTPSAGFGGQQLGGFAPSAAANPFSGGGALTGTGTAPPPLETAAAATGAPAPTASVANPGPVGAAVPPPAGAPLPAGSPAPVQGWPGAPAEPAQGATRYAMSTEERGGADPLLAGLVGLGGCCILLAVGAGMRRGGGGAVATTASPARAWAVGK